jgi:hypothetical protein
MNNFVQSFGCAAPGPVALGWAPSAFVLSLFAKAEAELRSRAPPVAPTLTGAGRWWEGQLKARIAGVRSASPARGRRRARSHQRAAMLARSAARRPG